MIFYSSFHYGTFIKVIFGISTSFIKINDSTWKAPGIGRRIDNDFRRKLSLSFKLPRINQYNFISMILNKEEVFEFNIKERVPFKKNTNFDSAQYYRPYKLIESKEQKRN